jgi:hypothetical protein
MSRPVLVSPLKSQQAQEGTLTFWEAVEISIQQGLSKVAIRMPNKGVDND